MASQPPVLTDDDIMRFRGQAAPPQPQPVQPYTLGRPDPLVQARENRAERSDARAAAAAERAAAAAERSAENVPSGYRAASGGGLEPIPGGPADPNRPQPTAGSARLRQLPNVQQQRLADGTTSLANLERALNTFRDDYAGNSLTGGLENSIQSRFSGFGTPGQAQYWSDVAATDNVGRNQLFGASLTEGEKAAWEATTINPSMAPDQIRANLTRRMEIARAALSRLARTNAANGYNREAIEASLGDYAGVLQDGTLGQAAEQSLQGAAQGSLSGAATGEGDPNFNRNIHDLPEGSAERFRMLEALHNAHQNGEAEVRIGVVPGGDGIQGDPNGPTEFVGRFGTTEEQERAFEQEYQRELPRQQARDARERFNRDHPILGGADTFVRSAANAMTLGLADRLAGGLNGTTPEVEHAITNSDWENRPVLSFGGTLAGGSVLPLGSNALAQSAAGAGYGGAYNYFASDGTQGERVQNALLGAATGGTVAALVNGGMRVLGHGGGGGSPSNAELVQAARRQNVDLMPADLGNPTVARVTGGMRQTIGGAGPVARAAQRTEQQVGRRLNALANQEGAPVRQEVLGDVVRTSLENFNTGSGEHGRRLYANARDASHDSILQGGLAFRNVNAQIRELSETGSTSAPLIGGLDRLRADIASDEGLRSLSVDAIRRLRTNVRAEAQTDALRGTDYQRRAGQVLDALSEDIASQLPRAAAREFREADRAWAERLNFIDDVENNILGPKNNRSAEAVAQRLLNMTRGDSARFVRVLDTVSAEESRMIRGSAIENLGRAANGSPNAGGFSMDTFLTNYEALPARTRRVLFRGQSSQDVDDLITIARARRVANQSGNFSGTAGAVNAGNLVHNASMLSAWGTVGISTLAENLTGRLLASPRFVRAVTHPPREPGRALRALRRIAVTEPALRSNIDTLIQAVQRSGQNLEPALRAAASPQDDRQNGR